MFKFYISHMVLIPVFIFCLSGKTFGQAPNFFLGSNPALSMVSGALKVSRELKVLLDQLEIMKEYSETLGEFNRNLSNANSLYKRRTWLIAHVKRLSKINPLTLQELNTLIRRYKSAYRSAKGILSDTSRRISDYVDRNRKAEQELIYNSMMKQLALDKANEGWTANTLADAASVSAIANSESWTLQTKQYDLALAEHILNNKARITKEKENYKKATIERRLREYAELDKIEVVQRKLYKAKSQRVGGPSYEDYFGIAEGSK